MRDRIRTATRPRELPRGGTCPVQPPLHRASLGFLPGLRAHSRLAALVASCIVLGGNSVAGPPAGREPVYANRELSQVPNESAMRRRLWSPGLEEGFVPQGVTFADGRLLVATYHSVDPNVGRGPCRIYHVDRDTGAVLAYFAGPPACGHAGGIEYAGHGVLYIGDDERLFRIDLTRALADGDTHAALLNTFRLEGALRADYLAFDGETLWMGAYSGKSVRMHGIAERTLSAGALPTRPRDVDARSSSAIGGSATLSEADATSSMPVPPRMQGVARDKSGLMWLTQSGGRFGRLQKADATTGRVLVEYEMPAGIEDIAFDDSGRLWAVSEAGSQRWLQWATFFPVIFELDPAALR